MKVLVVDDSSFQRKQIIATMGQSGFDVKWDEAKDGEEAVQKIDQSDYDFLVLDINMPKMTGLDVLEKINGKKIFKKILIHTADVQESTRNKCLELGAWKVVYKSELMSPEKSKEFWEEFFSG